MNPIIIVAQKPDHSTVCQSPSHSSGTKYQTVSARSILRQGIAAALFSCVLWGVALAGQPAPQRASSQPVELMLEDQFERKVDVGDLRGNVAILVYGDRKATDACRQVGESLQICWHPDAKGQTPAKAQTAPVIPLPNLPAGKSSPNVLIIPVACCGKVPGAIRGLIRGQIAKTSPDVVVWLDFGDTMKTAFGATEGEPNFVVLDAAGRLRLKILGALDQPTMDRLVKSVQSLRYEAVK